MKEQHSSAAICFCCFFASDVVSLCHISFDCFLLVCYVGFGRLREALGGMGRLRKVLACFTGFGRLREVLLDFVFFILLFMSCVDRDVC